MPHASGHPHTHLENASARPPCLQVSELLAAVDTSGVTATMVAAENENPEALDTILKASMTLLDDEVTTLFLDVWGYRCSVLAHEHPRVRVMSAPHTFQNPSTV